MLQDRVKSQQEPLERRHLLWSSYKTLIRNTTPKGSAEFSKTILNTFDGSLTVDW